MTIPTIEHDSSLDNVWEELVFTDARARHDPNAADLAPQIAELIQRTEAVRNGQYAVWRAEIVAQAGVAASDDDLDDLVDEVDGVLLQAEGRDRTSARYRRYFPKAPSSVIRLGLESQLGKTRAWPESLKSEPEPQCKTLGERMDGVVKRGDEALGKRRNAIAATADHRVREIVTLIDDVNNARLAIYGVLLQRAAEKKLPKDWAKRFFRRSHRTPKQAPPTE